MRNSNISECPRAAESCRMVWFSYFEFGSDPLRTRRFTWKQTVVQAKNYCTNLTIETSVRLPVDAAIISGGSSTAAELSEEAWTATATMMNRLRGVGLGMKKTQNH